MDASPFGKLSAEIRNEIYGLVLNSAASSAGAVHLDTLTRTSKRNYVLEHSLIHTCSQIRQEFKPMFYARKSFQITIQHRQYHKLKTWLGLVGEDHLRLIKVLEVVVMERGFQMLLAVREVVALLGMKGVRFRIKEVNLENTKQPGRREKGHGRYPKTKKGWKG